MFGSGWVITHHDDQGHEKLFCIVLFILHLFLISSTSVRSIPFLVFIFPILAWNIPLVSLIFLKRSLVFPMVLFSSVSLHWSLTKAFLSLLAILWNSALRWVYLYFSHFPFASLYSYLWGLLRQPFYLFAFLSLGDGLDPCLLYNAMNLHL